MDGSARHSRENVRAVAGEHNVADIGTKILPASRMRNLKEKLGVMTLEAAWAAANQKQVAAATGSMRQELLALIAETRQANKRLAGAVPTRVADGGSPDATTEAAASIREKVLTLHQIRESLERDICMRRRKLAALDASV